MKAIMVYVKSFLVLGFLAMITACNSAPGSYPYAEKYELNYSEEEVKAAISEFKEEHPEYIVPEVTIDGQETWELMDEQSSQWYIVYFYYPKENQVLLTWARPAENGKTTFAFVSINEGLTLGNWKEINKDFSRSESMEEKKKFEERILNNIKEKL